MDKSVIITEIKEIVDRETKAWNTQDIDLLMTIFHPDFVWVWPENNQAHDPINWQISLGKFSKKRWWQIYSDFFTLQKLQRNDRQIIKIEISQENDGAFAVVDIDTLWQKNDGTLNHWLGRVCKVYAKVDGLWKLTMHTGVLRYP